MNSNVPELLSAAARLLKSGQITQAQASCRSVLHSYPNNADALHLLGLTHAKAGNDAQAEQLIGKAIELNPAAFPAYNNRGVALRKLGRTAEAIDCYSKAVELRPDYADAYNNLGSALLDCVCYEEALAALDRAVALRRDFAPAHNNRGIALAHLQRVAEAVKSFDEAIRLRPGYADAFCNRANALLKAYCYDEAIVSFKQALAADGAMDEAQAGLAEACLRSKRYIDARNAFAALCARNPDYPFALGNLLHAKMLCCDWQGLDALRADLRAGLAGGALVVEPFVYQGLSDSESGLKACAEIYAEAEFPAGTVPLQPANTHRSEKIVVGYLCGEFRQHATSMLMCGVYEHHDRERFKLVALDNGGADGSDYRARIERSFEEIIDIRHLSDLDAANLIRSRGVDVLVNLNGYFGDGRQGVFAHRPADLQVNYLGFPGTLGASYIDYLIADRTVIPEDDRDHYVEKIVYLPHCYQANDATRRLADRRFERTDFGLPADAFVYCCFNNTYKITPATFDVWMRILKRVDNSVLWLLETDPVSATNLRLEAEHRGVAGERLKFSRHMAPDEHLRRHELADLFLDTLPYNAHTTASDALWAGLPLLTLVGTTFAGRVGASLLRAVGLNELITATPDAFEEAAIALAANRDRLAELRQRLAADRTSAPLFDTGRFTRGLEAAFVAMMDRHKKGIAPEHFSVSEPG